MNEIEYIGLGAGVLRSETGEETSGESLVAGVVKHGGC